MVKNLNIIDRGTSIRIGANSGQNNQKNGSIAIGLDAGQNNQNEGSIAIGAGAGNFIQNAHSVAIGYQSATSNQGTNSIAIGNKAGVPLCHDKTIILNASGNPLPSSASDGFYVKPIKYDTVTSNLLAWNKSTCEIIDVGNVLVTDVNLQTVSDNGNSTTNSITVPEVNYTNNVKISSDLTNTRIDIGYQTGVTGADINAIAMGINAGNTNQGISAIAIGDSAGWSGQNTNSIAIGTLAGYNGQGTNSIAIGGLAGQTNQAQRAVAIGYNAGTEEQKNFAVAIGVGAGEINQGVSAVALGDASGKTNQGQHSISIGAYSNAKNNSIVLNASGTNFHPSGTNGFYVNPIRKIIPTAANMNTANVLIYSSDREILDFGLMSSVVLFRDTSTKSNVVGSSNVNYENCFGGSPISAFNSVSISFKFTQQSTNFNSNVILQLLDGSGNLISDITNYTNLSNGSYTGTNTDGFYISGNISTTEFAITEVRLSPVGQGVAAYGVNIVPINKSGDANQEYVSGGRTNSYPTNISNQTYGIRIRCPDNSVEFLLSDFTVIANIFA
jgi:hypothetical protein